MSAVMAEREQARLPVHVQPGARQNSLAGIREGVLYVRIAAPPVKGKANQELIRFLSGILAVSRSSLTIEKGLTSKRKTVRIDGLPQGEVARRLAGSTGIQTRAL